ncbi:MAG: methyltransferase domain-containing protein [Candidatus Sungbacteria bacterium]|nr:methyltransferase domain-containing protein [Candidatus Sungbacteria bacterium]
MNRIYEDKKELSGTLIKHSDVVLDIGFWGQGVNVDDPDWVHTILLNHAAEVFGLDVYFDAAKLKNPENYVLGDAEDFHFPAQFDVIFAGDLIGHLCNPGSFLDCCARALKVGGKLVLTTPNCFNLFNLAEKLTKEESTVNSDHTCYFNSKTMRRLLEKKGWYAVSIDYLYRLDVKHKESYKKKLLNVFYHLLFLVSHKYTETLVIVAQKNDS